jgi:hypothetical protein
METVSFSVIIGRMRLDLLVQYDANGKLYIPFRKSSPLAAMDRFQHRVHDEHVVGDVVAYFVLSPCFHDLALSDDQLVLDLVI